MDFQTLVDEYASIGLGEHLYQELLQTVHTVSRRYPVSYSPTGYWDEDAFTALAHDWAIAKLWRLSHLEHLLLTNQTLRGFRNGLAFSFRYFLISQKDRTALDNLFPTSTPLLERAPPFRLF